LHTVLYQQGGADELDLAVYLETLTGRLRGSLLQASHHRLECDCDPCRVNTHDAVSLGLVVNELVTNAVKYAFPDGRAGLIRVSLTCDGPRATIRVVDDGVGLPPDVVEGLGLRLVRSLCRGLQAELTLSAGEGLCAEIAFSRSPQAAG
jgi:two-component sensor histidine kinase